jgi:poly(hydroxyalkanoate) granule-associated protein
MMGKETKRSIQDQVNDMVIDVRNEVIVQSANLYLLVRRVLLASIGAMALSAEEVSELLARLAERGEIAEADMQKLLAEIRAASRKREAEITKARDELTSKAEVALEDSVETILQRLNVPKKVELEELSRKIGHLNDKVTRLNDGSQNGKG